MRHVFAIMCLSLAATLVGCPEPVNYPNDIPAYDAQVIICGPERCTPNQVCVLPCANNDGGNSVFARCVEIPAGCNANLCNCEAAEVCEGPQVSCSYEFDRRVTCRGCR